MKKGWYKIRTNLGEGEAEGYICKYSAFCDKDQIGRILWYAVTHLPTGHLIGYVGGRKNVEAFCRELDQIPGIGEVGASDSDNDGAPKMALTQLAHKYRDSRAFARDLSEACDHSYGVTE